MYGFTLMCVMCCIFDVCCPIDVSFLFFYFNFVYVFDLYIACNSAWARWSVRVLSKPDSVFGYLWMCVVPSRLHVYHRAFDGFAKDCWLAYAWNWMHWLNSILIRKWRKFVSIHIEEIHRIKLKDTHLQFRLSFSRFLHGLLFI